MPDKIAAIATILGCANQEDFLGHIYHPIAEV